jgi:prepilin-type processing-associated H-X9-DG protein
MIALTLSSLLVAGCKKPKSTEPEATSSAPTVNPTTPVEKTKNVITRTKDRALLPNALRQIGLAYHNFWDTTGGKGPASQKDLAKFYENNANINKLLNDNIIVVIYGATMNSMTQGTSNTILAYEKDSDQGMRHVLFADGHPAVMNQADFDKAPKADGK